MTRVVVGVEDDGGDPVAGPGGDEPEGGDDREREVALLVLGGAVVEAGAAVDDEPGLELAIGDGRPHLHVAGPGCEVPVDAAHVVAGFVPAAVAAVAARTGHQTLVVAVDEPVELPGDRQLELAQEGLAAGDGGRRAHAAQPCTSTAGTVLARRDPGRHDAADDVLDHLFGRDAVGDRVEGQQHPVAEHVAGDVEDVLGDDVVAVPQQGEGPPGGDEAQGGARAGAVRDEWCQVAEAGAARARGCARTSRTA